MGLSSNDMESSPRMRVFLSSVGRRSYLVHWFRDAADLVGAVTEVWAGDGDLHAPGLADADKGVILPPIASGGYVDALVKSCVEGNIDLLISLHDYDIARISQGALRSLAQNGVRVAVPPIETLELVTDKLLTVEAVTRAGLHAPLTVLASHEVVSQLQNASVVKHRYGSASSGVFMVEAAYLQSAITMSSVNAPRIDGTLATSPEPSLVVVQERILGEEFGLDIVCDFDGKYQGVLARRKLRMRAGETDRAVTVDPSPFSELARRLASTLALRGSTDVDVIVTPQGDQYIIDINPRFGGGYPFVHMAGANVPACYLAWASGREIDSVWLQYEFGVVSSKYEAIQRSGNKWT